MKGLNVQDDVFNVWFSEWTIGLNITNIKSKKKNSTKCRNLIHWNEHITSSDKGNSHYEVSIEADCVSLKRNESWYSFMY